MHALSQEKIYTDVLVIGGGLAGLTAALEVKSNNVDVTIVSKGKAGKSGNSMIAGAGMSALGTDPEDSAELFYKDVIESGKEINDRQLVKFFVRNSTEEINKLSKYGVIFKKNNNHLIRKRPPGHSVSRFVHSDYYNFPYVGRGLSITLPLLSKSQKCGVKIVDNTSIIKLLVSPDHRVYGAIGINKKVGKIFVFYTNVIILASGGG
ncbi:MAG: FAD-dependent oxidoreductase, partial [Desulfobacteraceae bacterium]|nr:FAD-dependent oxidoreductase [Desulfobacteraceae bacterium]